MLVDVPVLVAPHRRCPPEAAMAVSGGRIVAVGSRQQCRHALAACSEGAVEVIRAPAGSVVVPGFVDPHLHLRAMAAARCSVDLAALADGAAVRRDLAAAPGDGWLRAVGWDESLGHGPLTRADLDAACGHRPVVVHHATGYRVVLNTAALQALGTDSAEAGDGDGELPSDHPILDEVPRVGPTELASALCSIGEGLTSAGVVAVEDATATNDAADVDALTHGGLTVRVRAMVGVRAAGSAPPGTRVKVIVDEATSTAELSETIAGAHRRGQPVALHVVDVGPLQVALDALTGAPPPHPGRPDRLDRLEHVSLCLPEQVGAIARAGVAVVTQPTFLVHRSAKYRSSLSSVEQRWLYRLGSLASAGVRVAASSDAPVVPARPLESVQAMVERDHPAERVDVATALDLVTRLAAVVSGAGSGVLDPGHRADFTVLGADPTAVVRSALADIPVLATWVDGRPATRATVAVPGAGAGSVVSGRCCG
ncbi:MAG: amidohydrolase family protein [Nocardioides sp.]|uniref:amidohydrolase n=1 Tax=Nocardioides sp. TaxID=35761 RepID=UPI0023A5BD5E|nr:amidohydrolase family protein [Nocardioides sp.]MDE0778474.1 amidohydrolase family protein [Nocardioides sp.]